jgi:hypothetical protein
MNTTQEDEVSTWELDVYFSSGRRDDATLEAHIANCTRCSAYLASLAVAGADETALAARAALQARAASMPPEPAPSVHARRRGGWWAWTAGAATLVAGVAVLMSGRRVDAPTYVGVKGTPAVQLLVHRAGGTRIWDGRSPIRPGDALALRVACEGFSSVAIATPGPKTWTRLSDTACPSQDGPLPFTLLVDSEPGNERVAVVLSQKRLDDKALGRAITQTERTSVTWVVDFVLPKEAK